MIITSLASGSSRARDIILKLNAVPKLRKRASSDDRRAGIDRSIGDAVRPRIVSDQRQRDPPVADFPD